MSTSSTKKSERSRSTPEPEHSGKPKLSSSAAARPLWVWCVLILCLAALLRFWAIDHGLPFSYYADEDHFVKRSIAFGSWDLNPHWFHKPAFFMYVLFFEYGIYFVVGKMMGWWGGATEFALHYFRDPGMFYLLGRITATLAGLGVVALGMRCGRHLGGRTCGLVAGLILATNFCLAEAGRWVKADVPCTLLTLLAAYGLIRAMESGQRRHYWLAGLAIGVGTATKYYAVALVPSVWLVFWLRPRRENGRHRLLWDRRPWEAMLASLLAFFVCSPFNVLDFETWWRLNLAPRIGQILSEKLGMSFLAFGTFDTTAMSRGLYGLLHCLLTPECLGIGFGLLAVAGIAYQLTRPRGAAWVPFLAAAPFVAIAVLWNPIGFEPRYLSPILPLLVLAAAQVLTVVWQGVRRRCPGLPAWTGVVVLAVLIGPGLDRIVNWNQRASRKDTRTIAAEWLERNIPAGTRIVNDNDWVKVRKTPESLALEWQVIKAHRAKGKGGAFLNESRDLEYRYAMEAARRDVAAERPTFWIYTLHHPWWAKQEQPKDLGKHDWDLDMGTPWRRSPLHPLELRAAGVRYVVTTAKTYEMYKQGRLFGRFKQWGAFYRWLEKQPLIYTIPYQPEVRPGPTVRIHAVH